MSEEIVDGVEHEKLVDVLPISHTACAISLLIVENVALDVARLENADTIARRLNSVDACPNADLTLVRNVVQLVTSAAMPIRIVMMHLLNASRHDERSLSSHGTLRSLEAPMDVGADGGRTRRLEEVRAGKGTEMVGTRSRAHERGHESTMLRSEQQDGLKEQRIKVTISKRLRPDVSN